MKRIAESSRMSKERLKCHKKGVSETIGNIKDEKEDLQTWRIKKGIGNSEHWDQCFANKVHF